MAKPKILLVDDTKLVLELTKSFLKQSPLEILTAGNGLEALDVVRKELPDVIFMDINMPMMDGIECCTILKADPFLSSIPIVMLTTVGSDDSRELCRQAGCDDYLTKPIDRLLFLEKARSFIDIVERRDIRVASRFPLLLRMHGITVSGMSDDVSEGGIFVAAEQAVKENAVLDLAFFLPLFDGGVVWATGRVVWLNNGRERLNVKLPVGFGVQFTAIEQKHQMQLKKYIDEKNR